MVVEFLDESQEWPINLPPEPERDRPLEARKNGVTKSRWDWDDAKGMWLLESSHGYASPWHWHWFSIVSNAMQWGHELVSLPVTGDGE